MSSFTAYLWKYLQNYVSSNLYSTELMLIIHFARQALLWQTRCCSMFKDQSPIFTATDLTDWACLGLVHQFFRFVPNLLYQVFDWGCQIRSCTTYSYQEKAIFGSYIGRLRWSYCIRSLIGSQIGCIRSLSNVLLSRRVWVGFRHWHWSQIFLRWHSLVP